MVASYVRMIERWSGDVPLFRDSAIEDVAAVLWRHVGRKAFEDVGQDAAGGAGVLGGGK